MKLVPPPGPASTAVRDAEPGRAAVEFGWDADALHLRIRGAQRGDRLGIYLPSHAWDPRTEAPEGAPSNPTGVEGAPTLWYGQAARHRIDVDLSAAPPAVTLWNADGRGGWSAPALLGGPVPAPDLDADDPGDVQLSLPLALLGLNGRALAFLVALSRDGALVDTVPETGWRYVHGGPPNANPDPPSLLIEGATVRAERPASIETYALVNAHGAVVDVPERHAWSWFTDRGEFDERRTRGDEDEARTNVGRLEPGARWYVVVRDGRGGTAWTARDDVLDSGP